MLTGVIVFLMIVAVIFMPIIIYLSKAEREEKERQKAKSMALGNVEHITETD